MESGSRIPAGQKTDISYMENRPAPEGNTSHGHRLVAKYSQESGQKEACTLLTMGNHNNESLQQDSSRVTPLKGRLTHLLNQLKNTFSFSSEEKIDEKKLAQKYRKEVKESLHIHDLKKKMLEYFADDQQMAKFYQLYQGSGATLQFRIDFTGKDQNRKLEDYQKNDPVFFKLLLSYPKLNEEDKATLNTGKPFTVEITVLTREESKSKPSVNEESEEHKSDIACAAPAPPGPTGPANRSPSLENNPRYLSNAEYSPAYSDIW